MKINKNHLIDQKQEPHNYKVEIASEIGIDNYYYIYSNLTPKKNKSVGGEPNLYNQQDK